MFRRDKNISMLVLWVLATSIVHNAIACSKKGNDAANKSIVGSTKGINGDGPGNPGKTPQTPNGGGGPDIPDGPDRPGGGGGGGGGGPPGGGPPGIFATCPGQPPFVMGPRSPGVPTTWETYKYKAPPEMLAPSKCEFEFPTYSTLHNRLDIVDGKNHIPSTTVYKLLMTALNRTRYAPCGFFDKERKPRTGKCNQVLNGGLWESTAHFVLKLENDPLDKCISCMMFLFNLEYELDDENSNMLWEGLAFPLEELCFCYRSSTQEISQRKACEREHRLINDFYCRKDGKLAIDGNIGDNRVRNLGAELYFAPGEVTMKIKANITDADWQVTTGYIYPVKTNFTYTPASD